MKLKLIEKKEEAKATKTFFWEPEKPVLWLPGQYFYYTLPKLDFPDERGDTRHFTIASSPTEGKNLMLTTRIREESGFKRTLDTLPLGTEIEGEGPNGVFTFDEKVQGPQILLAGGIGITPFRCFIKYAVDKKMDVPIYLIYSNSDSEFVYKKELDTLQNENSWLKIDYFDSSVSGHLDKSKIVEFVENWKLNMQDCLNWIVGPPPFVGAMENTLEEMKIPQDKIKTERFSGY